MSGAFDIAWALLKQDDFHEAFANQNPNYPTMQEAMSMQQDREFRDAFQIRPNKPRNIPESEYNPYDPAMIKRPGGAHYAPHLREKPIDTEYINAMTPPKFDSSKIDSTRNWLEPVNTGPRLSRPLSEPRHRVRVRGYGGSSLHLPSPSEIEQMLPPPFQESAPIPERYH
jgi:hypothetical protein